MLCRAEELGIEFYVQDRPLVFACRLTKPRILLGPLETSGEILRELSFYYGMIWKLKAYISGSHPDASPLLE
jgi:hypothetical protein